MLNIIVSSQALSMRLPATSGGPCVSLRGDHGVHIQGVRHTGAYTRRGERGDRLQDRRRLREAARRPRSIVVGYDMRLSSPALADAFAEGAMAAGARS